MEVTHCPNCEKDFGCYPIKGRHSILCKDCAIPRVMGRYCSPIVDGFNFYQYELCPKCKEEILKDYKPE